MPQAAFLLSLSARQDRRPERDHPLEQAAELLRRAPHDREHVLVAQRLDAETRGGIGEARDRHDAQARRAGRARLGRRAHAHGVRPERAQGPDLGRRLVRGPEHRGVDPALERDPGLARGAHQQLGELAIVGAPAGALAREERAPGLQVQVVLEADERPRLPGGHEAPRGVREHERAHAEPREGPHGARHDERPLTLVEMHASALHDHGQARELAEHDLAGVAAHAGARQVLELGAGDHAAPREPLREHPEARAEHDRERAAAGAALGELVRQGLGLAQGSLGSERHRRHSKMQGVHELLLPQSLSRAEALEHCRRYLATRIRRFRLAQALLPREVREDFIALLAWQRLGREISWGVEGFERRRGLDELASELDAALDERARSPVGIALSFAIRRHDLPEELLRRPLLEWKRDETLATFATREALLAHARALAVPEGRLLLRVGGKQGPRNEALADSLAIALQLTTWLAELAGELERGR